MNLWLFIWRMNPPHIGHLSIIDKMIEENDFVLVLVGTMKNRDEKNPLEFKQIKELLSLKYNFNNKLKIVELKDDSSDLVWVFSIYKILYENFQWITTINFYWWDFSNDSAYRVLSENKNHLISYNLNFIEKSRKDSLVDFDWEKYEISATNLRQALRLWKFDLASKFCDYKMFEEIKKYF